MRQFGYLFSLQDWSLLSKVQHKIKLCFVCCSFSEGIIILQLWWILMADSLVDVQYVLYSFLKSDSVTMTSVLTPLNHMPTSLIAG